LSENGLGAKDVAGEEVARPGQGPRPAVDENRVQLALEIGDMPRYRGLADVKFRRSAGE
jgi:hypothetical protein